MKVLAIGAHPDDVEVLCAGTLAQLAAAGHEIWIGIATNGNVGSPTMSAGEIASIRRAEAEAACAVLGAQLIWMDFDDEWLFNDRPTRARFIDAIREAGPDMMFVHNPDDYHPDHRTAAVVSLDARIPSAIRLVETSLPALQTIPAVFMMDTLGALDFTPEMYVDITATMETKRTMLGKHASQDAWLQDLYGMSYLDFITEQAEKRGAEAGVRYAEAFRLVRTYPPTELTGLLPNAILPHGV